MKTLLLLVVLGVSALSSSGLPIPESPSTGQGEAEKVINTQDHDFVSADSALLATDGPDSVTTPEGVEVRSHDLFR